MRAKIFLRQCAFLLLFLTAGQAYGADTLGITIQNAQKLFIEKNLSLLSAHYNISIQEAAEIQAKLLENPEIEIEGNLYNPEQHKAFDIGGRTGDYKIGIQQLIPLAGKRRKLMAIANTHTSLAKYEYQETSRGLLLTLRSNFYETHFLLKSKEVLNYQISVSERISTAFDQLQKQRNITATDAIIAKSLLYSLINERTGIENRLSELIAEAQILLASPQTVFIPDLQELETQSFYSLDALMDSARQNRPEIKISENNISLNQQNYSYEKALRTPDLTAGVQYERRGGFVNHATSFELGMAIPLFNRNQGNIKAAKIAIEQSKLLHEQQKLSVEKEVEISYKKYVEVTNSLKDIDESYFHNYEQLLQTILQNYQKKYLSVQELANFYENYKNNVTGFYELQIQKFMALEELNYFAGRQLFK